MENATSRVIGGVFMATLNAIESGNINDAYETLFRFAGNLDIPAEDRRVYACIAHSASLSPEEAAAENAELDELTRRPQLRVIAGGAA